MAAGKNGQVFVLKAHVFMNGTVDRQLPISELWLATLICIMGMQPTESSDEDESKANHEKDKFDRHQA